MAISDGDTDKIIAKLRTSYVIVPKWAINVWTAAILLVLAAIGVTSFGGFNSAVAASAAKAAEGRATEVAEATASSVAARRAGEAVDRVFDAATSAAEETAKKVAQRVASEMATSESRNAAEKAARDWLHQTDGKDLAAYLQQRKTEADDLLGRMREASKNADASTLAGLETQLKNLSGRLQELDARKAEIADLQAQALQDAEDLADLAADLHFTVLKVADTLGPTDKARWTKVGRDMPTFYKTAVSRRDAIRKKYDAK